VWRYYLLSSRPETGDTQFEWHSFISKNNSELLANLGNFVNRLIKFVNAKYNSLVPNYWVQFADPQFDSFKKDINTLLKSYVDDLEAVHLRAGLERVMQISGRGNQFLQENKLDNALLASQPERTAAVVGLGLNLIYLLSCLVYPYMPATAESIVEQLNAPLRRIPDTWEGGDLLPGHGIGKAQYLFSRIDEEWRELFGGTQAERTIREEEAAKKAKKQADKKKKKDKKAEK
jgi:methionyl-tRNA synthetase